MDVGTKVIVAVQRHSSLIIGYRADTTKTVSLAKFGIAVSFNNPSKQLQLLFVRPLQRLD